MPWCHGLRARIRENLDYDDSASQCSDDSSSSEEEATLHSEAPTKSGRLRRNARMKKSRDPQYNPATDEGRARIFQDLATRCCAQQHMERLTFSDIAATRTLLFHNG